MFPALLEHVVKGKFSILGFYLKAFTVSQQGADEHLTLW